MPKDTEIAHPLEVKPMPDFEYELTQSYLNNNLPKKYHHDITAYLALVEKHECGSAARRNAYHELNISAIKAYAETFPDVTRRNDAKDFLESRLGKQVALLQLRYNTLSARIFNAYELANRMDDPEEMSKIVDPAFLEQDKLTKRLQERTDFITDSLGFMVRLKPHQKAHMLKRFNDLF